MTEKSMDALSKDARGQDPWTSEMRKAPFNYGSAAWWARPPKTQGCDGCSGLVSPQTPCEPFPQSTGPGPTTATEGSQDQVSWWTLSKLLVPSPSSESWSLLCFGLRHKSFVGQELDCFSTRAKYKKAGCCWGVQQIPVQTWRFLFLNSKR